MKVFFGVPYGGTKNFGENYKKIYQEIENLGFSNVNDDVFKTTYDEFMGQVTQGRDVLVDNYYRKMNGIKSADICIFEGSQPSLGMGFLMQKALDENKPVIILYYKENVPLFMSGVEDERISVVSYNEKTLKKVLKEALEQAKERRDKRFNFFISPKLLEYIEKTSKDEGITKSKFIRNLIVDHMHKAV
jgi:hypothetical protein